MSSFVQFWACSKLHTARNLVFGAQNPTLIERLQNRCVRKHSTNSRRSELDSKQEHWQKLQEALEKKIRELEESLEKANKAKQKRIETTNAVNSETTTTERY